eukprot:3825341-Amphidinium_carterae.2
MHRGDVAMMVAVRNSVGAICSNEYRPGHRVTDASRSHWERQRQVQVLEMDNAKPSYSFKFRLAQIHTPHKCKYEVCSSSSRTTLQKTWSHGTVCSRDSYLLEAVLRLQHSPYAKC